MTTIYCGACGNKIGERYRSRMGYGVTMEVRKHRCVPMGVDRARDIIKKMAPHLLKLGTRDQANIFHHAYEKKDYVPTAIRLITGKLVFKRKYEHFDA